MKTTLLLLCLTASFSLCAQQSAGTFYCQTEIPAHKSEAEEAFNSYVLQFRHDGGHLDSQVRYIPTVVHVVMRNQADSISLARIAAQIEQTNLHMRRLNPDTINTREMFREVAADTHIELCMATTTPYGDYFNGVLWHTYQDYTDQMIWSIIPSTIWDRERYLNIWITPGSSRAQAWMPWEQDPQKDGILISEDLWLTGAAGGDPANQGGKTLTHELGHFLGLYHTFHLGHVHFFNCDFPHCDSITDRCCDTPPDWSHFPLPGINCDWGLKTCPNDSTFYTQNENYMYYNPDHCLNMFTHDQRIRMRASIHDLRQILVSEENLLLTGAFCQPANSERNTEKGTHILAYPNPVGDILTLSYLPQGHYEVVITVFDSLGRKLKTIATRNQTETVDFSGLPQGIYLIRIRAGNQTMTQKVVR